MTITNKIDTRTLSLVLIALIGGVIECARAASLSDTISDLESQISQIEVSISDIESIHVKDFNARAPKGVKIAEKIQEISDLI